MKKALILLKQNDPLRMAGATAFFTTFALPPILIILVQLFGLILNPTTLRSQLINDVGAIIGKEGAAQIKMVIENIRALNKEWYIATGGFLFLTVIATTLFSVVKNSLDQLWSIRVKDKPGLKFRLKLRLRSLGIILLAGLLFIVGLLSEGLMAFLGNYLMYLLPDNSLIGNYLINELFFIAIVTMWFCILFRYLTDGRPDWNLALMGGFFTAVLLNGGKLLLRWLLTYNKLSTIYGASGSIVLIMLFVFYSSIIFYYGGAFIKVLSDTQGKPIRPIRKAYHYELNESKAEEKSYLSRPKA